MIRLNFQWKFQLQAFSFAMFTLQTIIARARRKITMRDVFIRIKSSKIFIKILMKKQFQPNLLLFMFCHQHEYANDLSWNFHESKIFVRSLAKYSIISTFDSIRKKKLPTFSSKLWFHKQHSFFCFALKVMILFVILLLQRLLCGFCLKYCLLGGRINSSICVYVLNEFH